MWCEQYKSKKSTLSHETKVQFRPLAVDHIFHKTDTYSLFSLYKRGGIKSKAFKVKIWNKNFEKKNVEKMLKKKFWKKVKTKKFWKNKLQNKNIHNQNL